MTTTTTPARLPPHDPPTTTTTTLCPCLHTTNRPPPLPYPSFVRAATAEADIAAEVHSQDLGNFQSGMVSA